MDESASLPLPHGANGIELGDLAIEFRADKVILFVKFSGDRYTLHSGRESGVLDVHRTWRDKSGDQASRAFPGNLVPNSRSSRTRG
jgi:hypothetical protein